MKSLVCVLVLGFASLIFSSCATTGPDYQFKANDDATIFAVLTVDDMDDWLKSFKDGRGVRASVGIKHHEVYAAADGSGQVLVILQLYSGQMSANLLQTRLPRQWVSATKAKNVTFQKVGTILPGAGRASLAGGDIGIVWVRHEVKNVDKWVEGFVKHVGHKHNDSHDRDFRSVGHTVLGNRKYRRLLHVVHWVDDLDKAGEFMTSPVMKESMANAGVVGKSIIWLGSLIEEMDY